MRQLLVLSLLAALALLAGCAGGGHGRDINDPANSLVFGYVDMADAPTKVSGAQVRQVAPQTDKPYWGMNVREGLFYTYYLPPGSYQLATLHGSSFLRGEFQYNFPRQGGGQTTVRIDKPGIYFLGAHKYKDVKTGFFEAGKFDIQRVDTPTEAQLLQRILDEEKELKGSVWEEKIRQRIARLKK
jgi:predicted small secreted protein